MFEIKGKYTTAKVMIDEVEESCISQIHSMVSHPSSINPIAIMPDTHSGSGCVIGFTMKMGNSVVPNWIGVDIGCGVRSINVGKNLFSSMYFHYFDEVVREAIPFGTNVRSKRSKFAIFDWKRINKNIHDMTLKFNEKFGTHCAPVTFDDKSIDALAEKVRCGGGKVWNSIGTLGGGNHFIEVGKSLSGDYWITFHSGSRNFGKCIAEYHQKIACIGSSGQSKTAYVKYVKETFSKGKWGEEIAKFTDTTKKMEKGSEYLEREDMYNYLVDMIIAQEYASLNREVMIKEMITVLNLKSLDEIETTHNFIDTDDWIIRKGAVKSLKGQRLLIPFNMKEGILICEGKSNSEWNCSAPHGAGRVLSRSKAKSTLNLKDVKAQMKGVYTSCIPLDEAPDAYKDSTIIEICIEPTATIVNRLIPILNMKGGE